MKWPRRRWAVTRYYFGVAAGVVSRHWTERAANRAAARYAARGVRLRAEIGREIHTFKVARREPW